MFVTKVKEAVIMRVGDGATRVLADAVASSRRVPLRCRSLRRRPTTSETGDETRPFSAILSYSSSGEGGAITASAVAYRSATGGGGDVLVDVVFG